MNANLRNHAAELHVAANLGFNGIWAWQTPETVDFNLTAQLPGAPLSTISVQSRDFAGKTTKDRVYFEFEPNDRFDFHALVLRLPTGAIRTWIIPRVVGFETTVKGPGEPTARWSSLKTLESRCAAYENNFSLKTDLPFRAAA